MISAALNTLIFVKAFASFALMSSAGPGFLIDDLQHGEARNVNHR